MGKECPKCGSKNTSIIYYMSTRCVICHDCGYDESAELAVTPGERTSQKAKGRYSPYKAGGWERSKKSS